MAIEPLEHFSDHLAASDAEDSVTALVQHMALVCSRRSQQREQSLLHHRNDWSQSDYEKARLGYARDPGDLCETAQMMGRPASLGAMGIHFFRPDLSASRHPHRHESMAWDAHGFPPAEHSHLRATGGRTLELVAVENLVFAAAWRAAGHTEPPTFHGVPYDSMVDDPTTTVDEAHMFEPHFDRHVWIYRENPNGVFTPLNPAVSCAFHRGPQGHPAMHTAR